MHAFATIELSLPQFFGVMLVRIIKVMIVTSTVIIIKIADLL